MTIEKLYEIYLTHPSIQTDSRKLKQGDIFFALKGPNFNGNAFARQAIEQGAAAAVVDEKNYHIEGKTLLVEDALSALQQLARHHRNQFNIPFIGITGSNGKTTTKELAHAVLSSTFKTYTTEGNLNNHIGVPLTILKIRKDAQFAVIEMGANHIGEIASYCRIADPTHGLITNCGKAHLEGFGGEEGVRKGKGELFDHLRTHNHGHAFVMWDYDYLRVMSKGISGLIKYGTVPEAHVIGNVKKNDPFLEIEIIQGLEEKTISTNLVGEYNLPNVLAAVTIGKFFKVPESRIHSSISAYHPSNSRSQFVEKNGNKIIMDAYNANPSSMRLAIQNFANMKGSDKVLLLGSMAELGADSTDEHKKLVELISQFNWKEVVLVGKEFNKVPHSFRGFASAEEARDWFREQSFSNAYLLVKGSRSMQMEKVVE